MPVLAFSPRAAATEEAPRIEASELAERHFGIPVFRLEDLVIGEEGYPVVVFSGRNDRRFNQFLRTDTEPRYRAPTWIGMARCVCPA
jgi:hypothetical protein